jgi:hypothetical protein
LTISTARKALGKPAVHLQYTRLLHASMEEVYNRNFVVAFINR